MSQDVRPNGSPTTWVKVEISESGSTSSGQSSPSALASPKFLNPAIRRTAAEGGRHQRSHSIDTKNRTSPILGLSSIHSDLIKFAPPSLEADELTGFYGSDSRSASETFSHSTSSGSKTASLPKAASQLGIILNSSGSSSKSTIARKSSNGSSSSVGGEASPEHGMSPESKRPIPRLADKPYLNDVFRPNPSSARVHPGMPLSPRLQAASASGHNRRISGDVSVPHRVPSPIYLASHSPPNGLINPDPQHSWDSVWPRAPTPDRSIHQLTNPSSSPAASSSSPNNPPFMSPSFPQDQGGAGLAGSSESSSPGSPTISSGPVLGRPKPRRPHELRTSISSPTLRAKMPLSSGASTTDSPLVSVRRTLEHSKSDPVPRLGLSPKLNDSLELSKTHATNKPSHFNGITVPAVLNRVLNSSSEASSPHLNEAHALAKALNSDHPSDPTSVRHGSYPTWHSDQHPNDTYSVSPQMDSPDASTGSTRSPVRSPFQSLSAFPRPSSGGLGHESVLSESPPKTRSFIAMPPRSGYELSDDPDDVGSEEDGSSSGSRSVGTNDDDYQEDNQDHNELQDYDQPSLLLHDGSDEVEAHDIESSDPREAQSAAAAALGSGHPKRPCLTRTNAVPTPPPSVMHPFVTAYISPKSPIASSRGSDLLSYFKEHEQDEMQDNNQGLVHRDMEVESGQQGFLHPDSHSHQSALGLDAGSEEPMDESFDGNDMPNTGEQMDESLSTLERIFLFAKSDMAYHRVLVSSSLPDWIRDVELSDAVEYIIPLLNGLGTDELEVCAAFAPEIAKVMWFFFRNCPLVELNHSSAVQAISTSNESGPESSEPDQVAWRPRIPVSTFTSLLCALLLNQNNLIAGATQQSLVQFFCRLENRDPDLSKEELATKSEQEVRIRQEQLYMDAFVTHTIGRNGQPVPNEPYDFDEHAREAIRHELLENVAFAIAHLTPEPTKTIGHSSMEQTSIDGGQDIESDADNAQPQETSKDETMDSTQGKETVSDNGDQDSQPPIAKDDDALFDTDQQPADTDMMEESQMLESWNMEYAAPHLKPPDTPSVAVNSEYQADLDEEAAVGRMASVSLLAALCAEDLIHTPTVMSRFLPEILALSDDAAFFVRKEVASALGPLAKSMSSDEVIQKILPTLQRAMEDRIWHVRQAACFSLPIVMGRLDPSSKREKTVASLRDIVNDVSRNVRVAALEMIGETIFMFKDDQHGVPEELIRLFLGEPFDGPPQQGDTSISFDLDSPPQPSTQVDNDRNSLLASFGYNSNQSLLEARWGADFGMGTADADPERPWVMAFNIPAVVLTLGSSQWLRVKSAHAELSDHSSPKIRKSTAASLHEIAKVVGPQVTKEDLLPIALRLLNDEDQEVRAAMLENIDVLLASLPRAEAEETLRSLIQQWSIELSKDWRLRERLALHIPSMARQFLLEDEEGSLVSLMQLALSDPISAVRDAGVGCVPDLYKTFAEHDQVIADGFLGMVSDLGDSDGYRLRIACLLCIKNLVEQGIQRSSCEMLLLGRLIQMGNDAVADVRIALSRTVGIMCRKEELYASPQSRSKELNGLIARLARDPCFEVKIPVGGILSDEEASKYLSVAESPAHYPRVLVLGPADGGPHKPEPEARKVEMSRFQEADGQLFDMEDDSGMEDVEMGFDSGHNGFGFGPSAFYRPSTEAIENLGQEVNRARVPGRSWIESGSTSQEFFRYNEEEEEPHHLLAVEQDGSDTELTEFEPSPSSSPLAVTNHDGGSVDVADTISLSSPQRNFGPNDNYLTVQSDTDESPTKSAKTPDPFLAFVAGRRSQDLSKLKLNLDYSRGRYATQEVDDADSSQVGTAPVESLRSPENKEEGIEIAGNKYRSKTSGDWSQLGEHVFAPLSRGGQIGNDPNSFSHATTNSDVKAHIGASDSTEDDFVRIDPTESM